MRSKLLDISVKNLGCISDEGIIIQLDEILCLVGNNNTGKSTILRAYELAVGSVKYEISRDRNKVSNNDTEIEISVHIPEGIANIAEKWKVVNGDLRIVKSKWTWDNLGIRTRETFDPEIGEYSLDGNAAGLDTVFSSRLPKPFRIGALESPEAELKNLLKLIVDPIGERLKKNLEDIESTLYKSLELFNKEAIKPIQEEASNIEKHSAKISESHNSIFPDLSIDIKIGLSEFKFDPIKSLLDGSKLNIKEFDSLVDWNQQGTGSQRALFWSLLQVRSKLQSVNDLKNENDKSIKALESDIKKLEKERDKASKPETKASKQDSIDQKSEALKQLNSFNPEHSIESDETDIALPGYMLLIDEPEIALHPNGIRAASQYLYELAKDKSWQVMLTTHSPLFINPFVDNTTIVRLSRTNSNPSPLTYRSDSIKFSSEEKEQLTLLNTFDQNLSEMFFGQHPIIVEGDTEFAAFIKVMEMEIEKYPLSTRPLIIRARGKFTIMPIIKMLNHFKVDFSILHDSDYPKSIKGGNLGVWTYNTTIHEEILKCRVENRKVIHRISISTFELDIFGIELDNDGNVILPSSKGKPFILYSEIGKNDDAKIIVEKLLDELINVDSIELPFTTKDADHLPVIFKEWVNKNKIKDKRFIID